MEIFFIIIVFCLALYFSIKVFNNPSLAFPIILGIGIILQDLMFTQLQIENKVILLAVVLSLSFARKKQRIINLETKFRLNRFHEVIFLLLILFLFVQSIRGSVVYWRGITSFYWAIQFLVIGYIGSKSFAGKYIYPANDLPKADKIRSFITNSMSVYISIVLLMLLLPDKFFTVLNIVNPSKTVLFFPVTLFLPVVFLSIKDGGPWEKLIAKTSWTFAFVCIIATSSRGALLPFFVISIMGIFYLFQRKNIVKLLRGVLLSSILGGAIIFVSFRTEFVQNALQTLIDTLQVSEIFLTSDVYDVRDLDRILHILAAWDSIMDNWIKLLFGYGYRVSGLVLAPKLQFLYTIYLPHLNFISELGDVSDVVTFGISSMVVDFGFVGFFGFIALFFVIAIKIVKRTRGIWRAILLVNLSFLVLRLYGNNFLSYPLFYLALAPCGVFMYMIDYHRIMGSSWQRVGNISGTLPKKRLF